MPENLETRATASGEVPDLAALYRAAFPAEDLWPLVERLLADVPDILSLEAGISGRIVGHILFTPCGVGHGDGRVALLAPLAVAPAEQRRGVGSLLVGDGLKRVGQTDRAKVLVLGHSFLRVSQQNRKPPTTLTTLG